MKIERRISNVGLFLASWFILEGYVNASYDYTAAIDCVADPDKPQYNGGIIVNPEMNDGLNGWTGDGELKIKSKVSQTRSNNFIIGIANGSVSQKVLLEKAKLYTFSAWIQVALGVAGGGERTNLAVMAIFKTNEGYKSAGSVVAQLGCWSMLKGGITVQSSGPAQLYFQSNDTCFEIWVDSVSLQPFTQDQWRSHQYESIAKVRKGKVKFQVVDSKGRAIPNANMSIKQNKPNFPLGASMNYNIVNNAAYQKWFTSRFTVTTFENEMKWYTTENTPGKEDYSQADAMISFTNQHGIQVRGHNIFWDDPKYQLGWVNNLPPDQLKAATDRRLNSIVSRYANNVIAWDVNNENLHFNYFETKLGPTITDVFFQKTFQLNPQTRLFMNEYNTIEDEADTSSSPSKYIQKIKEIQGFVGGGGGLKLGIGLEGHFATPNIAYVRSALDMLAATNVPIWVTELDVQAGPNQASYFEQILREVHSHPGVEGIVIWGPWSPQGKCYQMCLVNPNFENLPPGDVVDKLLGEWHGDVVAATDAHGFVDISLFHGHYQLNFLQQKPHTDPHAHAHAPTLEHQSSSSSSISHTFSVDAHSSPLPFKIILPS
ncbi:unnamed protein product [Amaranthus hypochondriacus]